jgi:ABC-type multidrug transport system fused ATPase/permease subunit
MLSISVAKHKKIQVERLGFFHLFRQTQHRLPEGQHHVGNAEMSVFTNDKFYDILNTERWWNMNIKKKIIIRAFLTLIFITSIFFVVSAIASYNYDIDPAIGVDIFGGVGAVLSFTLVIMIGVFVVFYELDLFYTVYYFLIKPKTIAKSILNVLANASLLLVFLSPLILFAIYIVLRISYFIISIRESKRKE